MTSLVCLRAVTIVLSALGAIGNAVIAGNLISLWRSLRWEVAESEWESSYANATFGIDSIKLVWGLLSIYFSVSAVACGVGCVGAVKRNASFVRLFRDYSVVDLSVSAFATLIFSVASFRPSVRTTVCEELSRHPELMRDLAEAGLDLENCEPWFERAVVAIVAIMAVILVVRLQFTLAVSNFYGKLNRNKGYRQLEDGFESDEAASPRRIYLLPNRSQTQPPAGTEDVLVYAPVPLSSLSPQETHDLDATEAWVSRSGYHKRQRSFTQGSSTSRSPTRHHRHRSSTARIRLPTSPGEPLLPEYSSPKSEI